MKRWAFSILATASLLLLIGTMGIWVRSYRTVDYLYNDIRSVVSQHGSVAVNWGVVSPPLVRAGPWDWQTGRTGSWLQGIWVGKAFKVPTDERHWSVLGIEGGSVTWPILDIYGKRLLVEYQLRVPYWVVCLLESLLPAAWLIRRLRSRPHQIGMCRKCGYDLRASKERCPECGTAAPAVMLAKDGAADETLVGRL